MCNVSKLTEMSACRKNHSAPVRFSMAVRRGSDVSRQRGCTGDEAAMGLHTQDG